MIDEVERQVGIAPMLAAADDDPTGQQGRVGRAVLDAALPGLDDLQRQEALALACLTRLIASRDHGAPLT